ncbi:30S ribosomal protein S4 [Candidatus Roizmanbacteria bacterium RIFOXYB2_FULL_41_10]|uniref:Small ribosomal subunit protein uS4 n=1 Tax=Candidatus Roizmanbacteria bacterium RIFOXYA1_FULL_41_12 TaxID=1802082 RepID=A0A1F7K9A1_9BACT|nr:MAG: 30S ribosomal protein S4 [Candidatus Roizmanbacteria bacterium RIFOXYA1_FULL_41_12]OGK67855.1 MAG: 30S ribosomal protein S4 [Candidatus Roizmanbacteria bacterium RIFOXYB1_FULL_41_27]OGK68217.1 MAG: 30S ribosomal protein S4 [Candidatus Roizmanbacteria bacterium RIFOXYA2_FULL_41_8]OGK69222.1 MAG: 30S ribosomal protein S4 [Candidatus Roizmanbacteria bacterium RIFOXYB2_FULL_41_10]OGK72034.1 MAG: 30S ribosomal protein S4 [Candidatus Roizmanbacteria bacterium RIFOXYC1_FULL_41_16]OGK72987.1 M
MGRLLKSKNKLARREGVDLSLKTFGTKSHASLLRRLTIIPGKKTVTKRMRKLSDFGKQLREKQKLKRIYGLSEKGLNRYFKKAIKSKGNTVEHLVKLLEYRLDNVLYRLRMAPTRASARQLVTHGHVEINGRKMNIPSQQIQKNDKIKFNNVKTEEIPYVKAILEEKNLQLPNWLKRSKNLGQVVGDLKVEEYVEPVNMSLVVEFYSKL